MTSVDVVIASYRRPEMLARALNALDASADTPETVIVVARRDDTATIEAATGRARIVLVDEPGVVAAMRAGALACTSDVVAFCDDDAEPSSSWVGEIRSALNDNSVGGFGGRDVIFDGDLPRPTALATTVGVVTWWGRLVGNHHCGTGGARDVHVLKGVNCAYRRSVVAFPRGLRGDGAEAHFEVSMGYHVRALGYRLVYDPAHQVIHRPARREGADQREAPSADAIFASAYNLERSLPRATQSRRLLYVIVWGDSACPGLVRLIVGRGSRELRARLSPSWRGTIAAWRERRLPLAMQ